MWNKFFNIRKFKIISYFYELISNYINCWTIKIWSSSLSFKRQPIIEKKQNKNSAVVILL